MTRLQHSEIKLLRRRALNAYRECFLPVGALLTKSRNFNEFLSMHQVCIAVYMRIRRLICGACESKGKGDIGGKGSFQRFNVIRAPNTLR